MSENIEQSVKENTEKILKQIKDVSEMVRKKSIGMNELC